MITDILNGIKKLFNLKDDCNDCPFQTNEDPLRNKLFKCLTHGKMYRYICAASEDKDRNNLVVVFQDIESKLFYTNKWNNFFSTIKKDGNHIPRFEEQE